MEPTTPNSAATEHANVDNTEPREGAATERAATTEVMTMLSIDEATKIVVLVVVVVVVSRCQLNHVNSLMDGILALLQSMPRSVLQ